MTEYCREYLLELPLPLAQLYSRANNARQDIARQANAKFLFQAAIKLAAAVASAAYVDERRHGASGENLIDGLIAKWEAPLDTEETVLLLNGLARHFGSRPDAHSHPIGNLASQLGEDRRDSAGLVELGKHLATELGETPPAEGPFTLLNLLELFGAYSKQDHAQEVTWTGAYPNTEQLPLFLAAANELLASGTIELLGASGRLAFVSELRSLDQDQVELGLRELVGVQGERLDPITIGASQAEHLSPGQVAVLWPSRVPVSLAPLLHYRETELAAEVVFLRRRINDKQLEYFSFLQGDFVTDEEQARAMAELLSDVTGEEVAQAPVQTLAEFAPVQLDAPELQDGQIRLKLLDLQTGGAGLPHQWIFNREQTITIGREAENDVTLQDQRVSRRHAVIAHNDSGWSFQNQGSNGSFQAGQPVDVVALQAGDVIQLAGGGPRIQFDLPE